MLKIYKDLSLWKKKEMNKIEIFKFGFSNLINDYEDSTTNRGRCSSNLLKVSRTFGVDIALAVADLENSKGGARRAIK